MSQENNVIEMPEAEEEQVEETEEVISTGSVDEKPKDLTPEEVEKLQAQAKEEAEKSRILHLKAIETNHLGVRADFQNSVVESLVAKKKKGDSLSYKLACDNYYDWALAKASAKKFDCSEVLEECAEVKDSYADTINRGSLVGSTTFDRIIQEATRAKQGSIAKSLIAAFSVWNKAEILADAVDEFTTDPASLIKERT